MKDPLGPTSEAAVLAYAAPLIARMTINRDALRAGKRPLAHRTALLSPIATGQSDPLALNDGAAPSEFGSGLASTVTQAIEHATTWAIGQLRHARGFSEQDARVLLDAHVAWNVLGMMSADEVGGLSQAPPDAAGGI